MRILTILFFIYSLVLAKEINTLSASFVQTVTNSSDKTIVYKGKLKLKQPNKMLWIYSSPIEKYVYMIGSNIIIDEPELEQAIYTKINKEINVLELLNNPTKISKKYKVIFKNKLLHIITYKDDMDNDIKIVFDNMRINEKIAKKVFRFVPPKDYDIINN